ncbi:GINS [Babesia duncani]|uniref:GINS n=1 Tax=Babesia duncani TaxID=323732 RepID=A0AAD9PN23_9APIC|nr:GINS [Babesia duncani]
MNPQSRGGGTHYSLEVICDIFRNEESSLLLQSYPTEVAKRVAGEIDGFLSTFAYYAREYREAKAFNEHDETLLQKHKLCMEYFALCYLQASKNFYLYKAHRWSLVEELAVIHNGVYDVIPVNIIERLSDEEAIHLREHCEKIVASTSQKQHVEYSLVAVLKDIVTDDINNRASKILKFYTKGSKIVVPAIIAEALMHSNWIRIIKPLL